jgi:hypothetical protein
MTDTDNQEQVQNQRTQNELLSNYLDMLSTRIDQEEILQNQQKNQLALTEKIFSQIAVSYKEFTNSQEKINEQFEMFKEKIKSSKLGKFEKSLLKIKLASASAGASIMALGNITNNKFVKPVTNSISKVKDFMLEALDSIANHPLIIVFTKLIKIAIKLRKAVEFLATGFFQVLKFASKFAKFMIALPLKIGAASAKIGNSLRQDLVMTIGTAVESTKELFDISNKFGSGAGRAIQNFAENSGSSLLEFKDITSDSVKLFDKGAAGIANRIQALGQRLNEMGPYADIFGESLSKVTMGSAEQFNFFEKNIRSLGASAEDVAFIAQEAALRGENINVTLLGIQKSLSAVAKETGVNRKIISKNFLTLQRDIINFGHLSTRELQETSAQLTKMGLSAQDAISMFSKLDTFESAAQTSAMLSQTFGMNVDALKLIRAEKPEEIFEMFRNSMMATGRSFEQLNRHEKSLMASTTGLSAASLKALMDFRNAGMSYEDSMKKMRDNTPEAKQLKAFNDMSGSLKEIKNIMQNTSFMSSFMDGLSSSLILATGLSDKFKAVSKRVEEFYLKGIDFGRDSSLMKSFRNAFKPIEDTIDILIGTNGKKGLFNVKALDNSVKPFMNKLTSVLGLSFKDNTNVYKAQREFSHYLKNIFNFKNFSNISSGPGGTLFQAGGKLVGQLLKGFAAIGPGLIDTLADGFVSLVDFLDSGSTLSLGENFRRIFSISEDEALGITTSLRKILDSITGKILPSMFQLGKPVFRFIRDMVIQIVRTAFNEVQRQLADTTLGKTLALFDVTGTGGELAEERQRAKRLEFNASDIDEQLKYNLLKGGDMQQARGVGALISIVENEIKKRPGQSNQELLRIQEKLLNISENRLKYRFDILSNYNEEIKDSLNVLEGLNKNRYAGSQVMNDLNQTQEQIAVNRNRVTQESLNNNNTQVQPININLDGRKVGSGLLSSGFLRQATNPSDLRGQPGLTESATVSYSGSSTEISAL